MKYKNYLLMIVLENVGIIYIYWTKDLSMFYSNRYENWNIVKLYPRIRLCIYRFWLPHEPWIDVKFWEGKFFWIAYDNCVLCLRIFLFVHALNYCCNPCSVFCYILIIRIKTLVWYLLEADMNSLVNRSFSKLKWTKWIILFSVLLLFSTSASEIYKAVFRMQLMDSWKEIGSTFPSWLLFHL